MKIELEYSQNDYLKKYIHCYYDATIDNENYIAFPNYYIPTCIINNAILNYSNNIITFKKDTAKTQSFYCVNLYKKPIGIKCEESFQTFNIVFKPYGLAQFTNERLDFKNNILLDYSAILKPFFNKHILFHSYSFKEKIACIEDYLLSVLSTKNHTEVIIEKIYDWKLNDFDNKLISTKTNKTLYRAFKNICGEPPITIYNVIRLRKAMQDIIEQSTNSEKLIDIAYSLGFFDQAHFTKSFKKLAQKRPKDFFGDLTFLSDEYESENIFFEFMNNVR